ncbi:MAG: FG-GAP repeat protein [Terriglobia bacterium]
MHFATCLPFSNWAPRREWKTFFAVGVVVVFLFAGPAPASSQPSSRLAAASTGNRGGQRQPAAAGLSRLPLGAQSSISAALGRDVPGYQVRTERGRLEAGNARQKLAVDFTPEGVQVRSGSQLWRITLRGYGYGTTVKAAGAVIPRASLNRVEYRRGALTEWYVNGPLGLEQGFTLQRPPGPADGRPLTIALALAGDLTEAVDEGGTGLTLTAADGTPELRYRGLTAYDATGRKLPARLEVKADRLLLKVEQKGARYPVVIDPWVQLAELTASDGATGDELGSSADISGDTVVVGAPGCQGCGLVGAAYVFVEPPTGWANATQTAKLTASDGAANNQFGFAAAISGNTIVVGSHAANGARGAVYVFVEPQTGWVDMTETAKLTGSDITQGDLLGRSVAISGNTVVAGATLAATGFKKRPGAAYVFVEPPAGWANMKQTAKLTTSDGVNGEQVGYSVGIDGGTVVVGAPSPAPKSASPGTAYVFVEPPAGWANMTQTAKLTASDGVAGDRLGNLVAISGNTVVAGAPLAQIGSHVNQGAAYVFVEPPAGWADTTQTAKLTASDGETHSYFGRSVAVNASTIVVGAPNQTVGSESGQGAVYVFVEPQGGWGDSTETAELDVSNARKNDSVGARVGIDGSTLVAGASKWPGSGGDTNVGAAFVFASQ